MTNYKVSDAKKNFRFETDDEETVRYYVQQGFTSEPSLPIPDEDNR